MRIRAPQPKRKEADQLPLINIVFLMLVFFLIAGTIAPTYDLDVRPASAKDTEAGELRRPALFVTQDGKLSFKQEELSPENIRAALEAANLDKDIGLRIVADREADAAIVLNVLSAAQAAGLSRLFLVTLREGG
ncbi:MAG: biopolymer transporter ExbD [Pseudomonadota bacterium]